MKQYSKAINKFKEWYIESALKPEYEIRKAEILKMDSNAEIPAFTPPVITDELALQLIKALNGAVFYFLDVDGVHVSILKDEKFTYLINNVKNDSSFETRIACELAALEEGFKVLNEKL